MSTVVSSIITIAVCAGLLLVLYAVQRNQNRKSLDRVKKFIDAKRLELESVLKLHRQKIEDASVNLKTQQDLASAAAKNLAGQQASFSAQTRVLQTRFTEMDEIENRLDTYKQQLSTLLEMTENVEKNLEKIKKESGIITKFNERLDGQRITIDSLEKRIPALEQDFSQKNAEQLQGLSEELLKRFVEQTDALEQTTQNAVEKNELLIDEMESKIAQSFLAATQHAETLESTAFERLIAASKQRLNEVAAALEKKRAQSADEISAKIAEQNEALRGQIEKLRDALNIQGEKAASSLSAIETEFQDKIQQIDDSIRASLENCDNALREDVNMLSSQILHNNAELRNALNEQSETASSDLNALEAKLRERIKQIDGTLREDVNRLTSQILHNNAELRNALNEQSETASSDLNELETELRDRLKQIDDTLCADVNRLTSQISHDNAELQQQIDSQRENFEAQILENTGIVQEKIESQKTELVSRVNTLFTKLQASFSQNIASAETRYKDSITALAQTLSKKIDDTRDLLDDQIEKNKELAANFKHEEDALNRSVDELQEELAGRLESLKREYSVLFSRALDAAEETVHSRATLFSRLVDEKTDGINELIESRDTAMRELIDSKTQEIKFAADALDQAARESQKSIGELDASIKNYVETTDADLVKKFNTLNTRYQAAAQKLTDANNEQAEVLRRFTQSFQERIAEQEKELEQRITSFVTQGEAAQSKFLTELEKRLEAYKSDMQYRFERLDAVTGDVDRLEHDLHALMKGAEDRVRSDFDSFSQNQQKEFVEFEREQTGRMEVFCAGAEKKSSEISGELSILEKEVNELKEHTVENVSAKLSSFESDFLDSLTKRGEELDDSYIRWKNEFDSRLMDLAAKYEQERHSVETSYGEQLKERVSTLQEKMLELTGRVESEAKKAHAILEERIDEAEKSQREFVESYKSGFAQTAEKAEAFIKNALQKQAATVNELFERSVSEIQRKLDSLNEKADAAQTQSDTAIEGIIADIAQWKERVNNQFDETRGLFNTTLAAFEQTAAEKINEAKTAFDSGIGQFGEQANEQTAVITHEVETLKRETHEAIAEYQTHASQALEEAQKMYDAMLEDTSRRVRESNADYEKKLRAMKTAIQEIHAKNETAQAQMVNKMQADANALNMTLDDIDKRIKQFISQSSVFDKADELKKQLDNALAKLRADIEQTETFKPMLTELNAEIKKTQRMEEDMREKITRLSGEKKRINFLESDFKRLIELSQTMDKRIAEVQTTNDDIQNYQVEIRKFQETLAEITTRYDRLEKKNPVLDRTISDIDKSFEKLQSLEKQIVNCENQARRFPEQIEYLMRGVTTIMDSDSKINTAIDKLDSLSQIINDTDDKLNSVKTSREGLMNVEKRIIELSKHADDQVNLLHAITKAQDGKNLGRDSSSAVAISTKESVWRLTREGWKPEEIAKALNLAVREVELILEIPH